MRFLIIIIFSISLVSCGLFVSVPKVNELSNRLLSISDTSLRFADDTHLYVNQRIFTNTKPVVICIHGLGAHTESFNYLLKSLNDDSISTFAYDLKGFGRSSGDRGRIDNFGTYLDELDQIIEFFHCKYSPRKIVLLGESLGSLLILWYGSEYKFSKFDSAVLTSLTTTYNADDTSILKLIELLFWFSFNPDKRVFMGFEPVKISSDSLFVNWAYTSDVYAQKEISIWYLLQSKYLTDHVKSFSQNFNKSILLINGSKDFLSRDDDIKEILELIPVKNKAYFLIEGGMHSLINDGTRQNVFGIIKQWLNEN